jgi:hypothetical protein
VPTVGAQLNTLNEIKPEKNYEFILQKTIITLNYVQVGGPFKKSVGIVYIVEKIFPYMSPGSVV